eukprot:gene10192-11239_t
MLRNVKKKDVSDEAKSVRCYVKSFPGAKVEDMKSYLQPTINLKPDGIIMMFGTNNLGNDDPKEIAGNIIELAKSTARQIEHVAVGESVSVSLFGGQEFDTNPQEVENKAFLDAIDSALMPQAEQGPPISTQLAKIINGKFTTEFELSKRKEILEKYPPPSNCDSLQTPKVNPEIWSKLGANAKKNDMRISALQDTLVKATAAVTVSVNDLLSARQQQSSPDFKDLIAKLIDSIILTGQVNKELTFKRRDVLRPNLSNDFKQACSRTIKPTTFLFGDDLPEVLKQLQATDRIVSGATNFSNPAPNYQSGFRQGPGFNQFHRQGAATQSRSSFLGYRGKTTVPPKQNGQYQHNSFAKKRFTKN